MNYSKLTNKHTVNFRVMEIKFVFNTFVYFIFFNIVVITIENDWLRADSLWGQNIFFFFLLCMYFLSFNVFDETIYSWGSWASPLMIRF